jgi:hypothetical protein
VTDDGLLKIMDFGIAKRHDAPGFTAEAAQDIWVFRRCMGRLVNCGSCTNSI